MGGGERRGRMPGVLGAEPLMVGSPLGPQIKPPRMRRHARPSTALLRRGHRPGVLGAEPLIVGSPLGPQIKPPRMRRLNLWSQQGMILRPPDYESGATNQLSYGTNFCVFQAICGVRTALQLAVKTHKFKEL